MEQGCVEVAAMAAVVMLTALSVTASSQPSPCCQARRRVYEVYPFSNYSLGTMLPECSSGRNIKEGRP